MNKINKDRAERYLTAERMAKLYKYSSYTAYERARDHAISYPTTAWQWDYWSDVANIIKCMNANSSSPESI